MLATYQGASQRRGLWRPLHLEAQPGQVQGIQLILMITKYSNNHLVVQPARGIFYSFR